MRSNILSTYFLGRILLTVVFCLAMLLTISYIAIYQPQKTQAELNQEISRTRFQLSKYEEYQSVYKSMQVKLKQFQINEQLYEIPALREVSLTQNNLGEISNVISGIAEKSGLEIVSIDPDAQTLSAHESRIKINATFKGRLSNLRDLILNLGSLGYVEQITRIKAQDIVKDRKYKLRLWMNLS